MGRYLLWVDHGKSLITLCSILMKSKFVFRILIKSKIICRLHTVRGFRISRRPSQRVGYPPSSRIRPSWMWWEGPTKRVLYLVPAPYDGRILAPAPPRARVEEVTTQMDALQRWRPR